MKEYTPHHLPDVTGDPLEINPQTGPPPTPTPGRTGNAQEYSTPTPARLSPRKSMMSFITACRRTACRAICAAMVTRVF